MKDLVNVFEKKADRISANQSPKYKNPYVANAKPSARVRQDPKANAANQGARQVRDGENLRQ